MSATYVYSPFESTSNSAIVSYRTSQTTDRLTDTTL